MTRLSCLAAMLMSLAAPSAIAQRLPLDVEHHLADEYAMMRDFGRCSAFYTHLADHQLLGGPAEAEKRRGYAREARAWAETAFARVKPPAHASADELQKLEATIAAYTGSLESVIALEAARQDALVERGKIDIDQMNFCWSKRAEGLAIETFRKQSYFSGN